MDPTTLWMMAKPILAGQLRHALGIAFGYLLAHGALQSDQQSGFIEIGMSLAGWAVVAGWSWWSGAGKARFGALLQKMTGTDNHKDAVEAAKALPEAAAVDTKNKAITAGAVTGKVVTVLLFAFVLSAFLAGAAQAQVKLVRPTGNIAQDIAAATGSKTTITGAPVTDIQNFMNAKFLPDLQYALKLATASKNNVTADCYQAWIDIITTQQTAVQTKNPDGTTVDVPMPDPHVITEFEKLVELRNALQPESPFMVKCSPVASMVKLDIAKFMGVVISGGAGLATLVPGL